MLLKNLQYQPKVESAPARRYRTSILPQSGSTFSAGETIIINIPTRNNTALIPSESLLKFNANFTLGASTYVAAFESCGYHGFFTRCRIFHGSNLLEDIQNYNELAKALFDFQMPLDAIQGRHSVTTGTTNEYTSANTDLSYNLVKPVNRGFNGGTRAGASGASSVAASINLISLVGSLCGGKYLPLWEATSAPLRIELVIGSMQTAMCASVDTTNFSLTSVEYIGEFLELPDSAIAAIRAASSNPLQMVVPQFRAYTFSQQLPNATPTQISMPIPAKFSSLKSIFINHKNQLPGTGIYPCSSNNLGIQQYQVRVGSEVLPSNPVSDLPGMFNEVCKCFGSIADAGYQPAVDIDSYRGAVVSTTIPNTAAGFVTGVTGNSGSFLTGIDLEAYMAADKSMVFAGMNTNTSDIYYIATFTQSTGAAITAYLTAFANYDAVLVFENGVCYSRY